RPSAHTHWSRTDRQSREPATPTAGARMSYRRPSLTAAAAGLGRGPGSRTARAGGHHGHRAVAARQHGGLRLHEHRLRTTALPAPPRAGPQRVALIAHAARLSPTTAAAWPSGAPSPRHGSGTARSRP